MARSKFYKFKGLDGKKYTLTLKQKLFVENYLEFKGNGVEAIYESGYDPKNARVAASMAYENLIKPDISAYVDLKLEEYGFTDDNVKKQHLFLLNQFGDLQSKRSAVDMFYKLRGDYAVKRVQIIDDNEDLTDEEIQKEIARREKLRGADQKPNAKKKAKSS